MLKKSAVIIGGNSKLFKLLYQNENFIKVYQNIDVFCLSKNIPTLPKKQNTTINKATSITKIISSLNRKKTNLDIYFFSTLYAKNSNSKKIVFNLISSIFITLNLNSEYRYRSFIFGSCLSYLPNMKRKKLFYQLGKKLEFYFSLLWDGILCNTQIIYFMLPPLTDKNYGIFSKNRKFVVSKIIDIIKSHDSNKRKSVIFIGIGWFSKIILFFSKIFK